MNTNSMALWGTINKAIDLIPVVTKDNKKSVDVELINSVLSDVIEKMKSSKSNESEFKKSFGKLNFRLNSLKRNLDKEQFKKFESLDKSIDSLAASHGIKRYTATAATPATEKFKGAVRKISSMIAQAPSDVDLPSKLRPTKTLSEEYWKEFFDGLHRHPKALDKAFSDWKVYGEHEKVSFWEYLEKVEKEGKYPELKMGSEQVQYLTHQERKQYQVSLEMDQGHVVLKGKDGKALPDGLYITVLGPDYKFYAAQKQPGKFQHATFFAGKSVMTAGMFVVKEGILHNFISQSGHYKPEKEEMFKALYYMEKKGVDISKLNLIYGSGGEEMITIDNPKEWNEYQKFLEGAFEKKKPLQPEQNLLEMIPKKLKLDRAAAKLVTRPNYGGGIYSDALNAVMPADPMVVQMKWEKTKNKIARIIGPLPFPATFQSNIWENSARSQEELLGDAARLAPSFKEMCVRIGKETNTNPNFGPDDVCIVKSKESLGRKVAQDAKVMGISQDASLKKIGDALRGTMIAKHPKQITDVVNAIAREVSQKGGQAVFKNLWAEERQSGYIGVHAKIVLPIGTSGHTIIVELQIHLKQIMDGSHECVKEREHLIYEQVRTGAFNPIEVSAASKLLYLTSMRKVKV